MSHGTKYIVHQDETILATVSLVFRYLYTTKNSIKKLLYKSVGINSAVFKGLDKSSGVTGAHGSHFLMEESDPWITLHSGNASVFHALDHWPAQTVIYSPIQAAWVLLQDACIFPQPQCPMRIETVAEKIPGYLSKLNGVMHQIWP